LIDLHCHILPGVDDGPSDAAESLSMARQAVADGIKTIVATPHTLNGVYYNPFHSVADQVARLREIFLKNRLALDLYPGSESYICFQMVQQVSTGEVGTINGNGSYVLVEFPFQTIPSGTKDELFQLKLKGITPIIAHPERNLVIQHQLEILYELTAMGCLIQITAMSITGELGEKAMSCAHRLLDLRLAHVIASDAHSADTRPPLLSPAVEVAGRIMASANEAEAMVSTLPRAILTGEAVTVPEPGRPNKKRWWFRRKG
jgi:protein-tyrosine phosphatase